MFTYQVLYMLYVGQQVWCRVPTACFLHLCCICRSDQHLAASNAGPSLLPLLQDL